MTDIREWLGRVGLGEYSELFERNAIDLDLLPRLTDESLEKIGVDRLGHRIRLLDAIAALASSTTTPDDTGASPGPALETRARTSSDAERRQLTVMFCDLVGSTALSERLDPEDLRDVMRAYQDACAGAIRQFDGHIAQTLGDGLMVYFGYPIAHEDDAQRAVRAGLDIVGAVRDLSHRLEVEQGVTIAVRIGIHTGLVVAGEIGGADTRGDMAIVGETPNIAARIQGLADPGTVVVGDRTRRLVGDVFAFDSLGAHGLKGLSVPIELFRAQAERTADSRFEAMHPEGLTPFVGRDEEIVLLIDRWRAVRGGESQVVLLEGEPGIGKSRITNTFREMISGDAHVRLQYQCSPFFTNSAFYPITSQIERAAKFQADDGPDTRLDKLEALIGTNDQETLALIGALLSLPVARYPPLTMSPQKQRERTAEVFVEQIAKLAAQSPVLLVFEDVHWIDPTSLETLDQVIAAMSSEPVFIIITFRPEFQARWTSQPHVTHQPLHRLSKLQSRMLVERVTNNKPLPEQLYEQIVTKTDGVPLFIEELTKAVLESGIVADQGDRYVLSGSVADLAIPDTLHDSLMARLDKLIPVKEVAQVGAAIGREFSYQLVALLSPMSEADLNVALNKLVASELVFRRGTPPDATYTFKHALVQDAAYRSLLRQARRTLHREIAETLEGGAAGASEPELIAHHYTAAEQAEKAIPYWLEAGTRATARSANVEALDHLSRGLGLLENLPASPESDTMTLKFLVATATPIIGVHGWGTGELAKAVEKSLPLCVRVPDTPLVARSLYMQWGYGTWTGRHHLAVEASDRLLALADQQDDRIARLIGHGLLGRVQCYLGQFQEGRDNIQKSLELYDPESDAALALQYGQDPAMAGYSGLTWCLWALGDFNGALSARNRAMQIAKAAQHPQTLVYAHAVCTCYFGFRALDPIDLKPWSDEFFEVVASQNFVQWQGMADVVAGWVQAGLGQPEQGLAHMINGLEGLANAGQDIGLPLMMAYTAAVCCDLDKLTDGLELIARAEKVVSRTDEKMALPEVLRIKGELLQKQYQPSGDETPAVEALKAAVRSSRDIGSPIMELRAAKSLARLWQSHGKAQQAHDLLAPAYEWFADDLDVTDLKQAKNLLSELS